MLSQSSGPQKTPQGDTVEIVQSRSTVEPTGSDPAARTVRVREWTVTISGLPAERLRALAEELSNNGMIEER